MNLHQTTLDRIIENVPRRKHGYMEECLRIGKKTGGFIEFTTAQFHYLSKKYSLPPRPIPTFTVGRNSVEPTKIIHGSTESRPTKIGLGDRLHEILGPIGRDIHWPCMKGDGTTDLKPKSLCGHLRQTLNIIKT